MNPARRFSRVAFASMLFLCPAATGAGDPAASKVEIGAAEKDQGVPPIFAAMKFEDAIDANKTDGRLLVVKFTAEWCGPCKLMDRTTWRDAGVVKLVQDNGRALQVDVDKQGGIAREYGVRAMPTMIAFKKGEAVDRIVGYRDAAGLSKWLVAVAQGKTEAVVLEDRAAKAGDDLPVRERMELARTLVNSERFDKATEQYLWLWRNAAKKEPAMVGVRVSFMAGEIADLCERHEPAKVEFIKLRDAAEARLKGGQKAWNDLEDWLALNSMVGQEHKTLEWFDRIKGDADARLTLERFGNRIERLLEANERWVDLGRVLAEPLTRLRREWAMVAMAGQGANADEALRAQVRKLAIERFRERAATMYAALILAGRGDAAATLASKAVEMDDTPETRLVLVGRAVELNAFNADMPALLEQAKAGGAAAGGGGGGAGGEVDALRAKVDAGLAKPGR